MPRRFLTDPLIVIESVHILSPEIRSGVCACCSHPTPIRVSFRLYSRSSWSSVDIEGEGAISRVDMDRRPVADLTFQDQVGERIL